MELIIAFGRSAVSNRDKNSSNTFVNFSCSFKVEWENT